MKFLHVSDLHIGKRLHEYSFLEDQQYILEEIIKIAKKEQVDALLIAGDVYDKSVPLERGVTLFDEFLTTCKNEKIKVFLISGNHDSAERIHFGGRIMEESGIYIQGTFRGKMQVTRLSDEYGNVDIYQLPFVKPAMVRPYFDQVESYDDAVLQVLENQPVKKDAFNILLAHQFVTGGDSERIRCESESINVGGVDNVSAGHFHDFDYVALGHLHVAQSVGRDGVYYSGSPLKYSFSEAEPRGGEIPEKSVMLITVEDKVTLKTIPLKPKREMRVLRGNLKDLLNPDVYNQADTEDYLRVILTDEEELYEPLIKLRKVYPNILRLDFDNHRTRLAGETSMAAEQVEQKSLLELFEEFYEKQNNESLSEEQREAVEKLSRED